MPQTRHVETMFRERFRYYEVTQQQNFRQMEVFELLGKVNSAHQFKVDVTRITESIRATRDEATTVGPQEWTGRPISHLQRRLSVVDPMRV